MIILPFNPALTLCIHLQVHHVLKEHPYRQLALQLRQACPPLPPPVAPGIRSDGAPAARRPRVLGLTASLTYAVEEQKVKLAMQRICTELMVVHMETAMAGELLASGYHATSAPAEVLPLQLPQGGVAPGVLPESERKPHEMVEGFFRRVADGSATPFALRMVHCIRAMEAALPPPSFRSPLLRLPAREWGVFARKQAEMQPVASCVGASSACSTGTRPSASCWSAGKRRRMQRSPSCV